MKLDVKIKLFKGSKIPNYSRDGDVCLDCYARCDEPVRIEHGERILIPLGFALEIPEEFEGVVRPRSGKSGEGMDIIVGTIDTNYRGELKACVVNNLKNVNETLVIENGAKICQLAIRPAPIINLKVVDELSETNRGSSGFGSSGN